MPSSTRKESETTGSGTWTSPQAYLLAVITLVVGIGVGWFARGSGNTAPQAAAPTMSSPMTQQAGGPMGPGQIPGFGAPSQAPNLDELNRKAAPLLQELGQNSNSSELLTQIGNLYYDGKAFPQAIEYYRKALERDPKNVDVRTDMGTSYWYSGDPDSAIKEFEKSLSYSPTHAQTLFNMGIVKWQGKRDPKGAVASWEKLLQTNPNYPERQSVESLIERAKMHSQQQLGNQASGDSGATSRFPKPF